MAANVHLRVDAAPAVPPALLSQRLTDDFLVTLRATDRSTGHEIEHGLLRAGAMFTWLTREVGSAWRIETTSQPRDLPRTVTISAFAGGVRIGSIACRRLSRAEATAILPSFDRIAA